MSGKLWIALAAAAACWGQTGKPIPTVIPVTPLGGFVIPSGTELTVRINEPLSTDTSRPGDRFTGSLMDPVMVNGTVVLPLGTQFTGHVLENKEAGIVKGRAKLMLGLDTFRLAGRTFQVELTAATCQEDKKHKRPEAPDPNAGAASASRIVVALRPETVVHFTLGAPVRV